MPHILAEFTPLDPVDGTRKTVRAASAQDRTITGLNSVRWWPAISDLPSLSMRLFDGDFTSDVDVGGASMTLLLDKLERLDVNVRRYRWPSARVTLYSGASGQAWPWTTVFKGLVDRFEADGNRLKVSASVDTEPFEKDVLTLAYAGTGGAEGDANLKNRPKPWVFGRALNVEPVLINATDSVFQFSAYGPIQAVNALYERASDFGASIGDYASYAALVAATVPAGRWATCLAQGMVRLGAPPYGVITGDVDGDKPGGVWIRKTGAILNRIATNAGVSAGLIDTASLTALDTAVPYNINLVVDEQTTVLELAQRLARPCNAQAGVSWTGKLFVVRVAIGSPAVTLHAQGKRKPGVLSSVENDVRPPYWRIEMGAQRCWRVHTLEEIAFNAELVNRGDYVLGDTYREGNIVQNQGSSWLYTNPTATSGNAPPTLPTTSNAYWKIMAEAGDAGATGKKNKQVWKRSATQPATPTGAGTPSGWSATPPAADGNPLWMAASVQDDGETTVVTGWGAPVRIEGEAGFAFDLNIYALSVGFKSDGTVKDGHLPRTITATLKAGGTDLTGSATFTKPASSGNTSSVSTNVLTVTAVTADGYADIRCVYGSFDQTKRVQIFRNQDPAPPAAVTPPAGGYSTSQSSSSFTTVASDVFPSSPDQVLTVRSDASGVLRGVVSLDYSPPQPVSGTRNFTLIGKIVYRLAGSGGAWTDFGMAQTGSASSSTGGTEPDFVEGSLSFTQDKTGLTASTDYECGFMGRKSSAAHYSTQPTGNITIKQPAV